MNKMPMLMQVLKQEASSAVDGSVQLVLNKVDDGDGLSFSYMALYGVRTDEEAEEKGEGN
jgi:hypothetical protein